MADKKKKLVRPKEGRVLAGVAVGLSHYFGIDVAFVRVIWLALLLPGGFPGLIPYILFWIAMPDEK